MFVILCIPSWASIDNEKYIIQQRLWNRELGVNLGWTKLTWWGKHISCCIPTLWELNLSSWNPFRGLLKPKFPFHLPCCLHFILQYLKSLTTTKWTYLKSLTTTKWTYNISPDLNPKPLNPIPWTLNPYLLLTASIPGRCAERGLPSQNNPKVKTPRFRISGLGFKP